jgi:hypothetical protein
VRRSANYRRLLLSLPSPFATRSIRFYSQCAPLLPLNRFGRRYAVDLHAQIFMSDGQIRRYTRRKFLILNSQENFDGFESWGLQQVSESIGALDGPHARKGLLWCFLRLAADTVIGQLGRPLMSGLRQERPRPTTQLCVLRSVCRAGCRARCDVRAFLHCQRRPGIACPTLLGIAGCFDGLHFQWLWLELSADALVEAGGEIVGGYA